MECKCLKERLMMTKAQLGQCEEILGMWLEVSYVRNLVFGFEN